MLDDYNETQKVHNHKKHLLFINHQGAQDNNRKKSPKKRKIKSMQIFWMNMRYSDCWQITTKQSENFGALTRQGNLFDTRKNHLCVQRKHSQSQTSIFSISFWQLAVQSRIYWSVVNMIRLIRPRGEFKPRRVIEIIVIQHFYGQCRGKLLMLGKINYNFVFMP